ncbi:MAG: type II toxin-antitoxin system RelE/ParE family toxin [Candidatus Binataceae bacterium]
MSSSTRDGAGPSIPRLWNASNARDGNELPQRSSPKTARGDRGRTLRAGRGRSRRHLGFRGARQSGSCRSAPESDREKCRFLATTPKAGRQRPELDPSIRSFVAGSYVIFYREGANGVEVARVLHGRRDVPPLFRS